MERGAYRIKAVWVSGSCSSPKVFSSRLSDALTHDGALQDGEFFVKALGCACAAAEFVEFCPEGGTVVEFFEVAELVANDIVDEVGG